MHEPVIEGNYKVTGDTRVIPIVENEYGKIQWAYSTYIYTNVVEPETPEEEMARPNGHLWKMYAISEVNIFLSRKAWILTNIRVVKAKGRNKIFIKWVFNIKEDADGLICMKLRNLVKGYMQVPGVDLT